MSPSFSFIKPVSPRKAKKSKSQPISPFAHQPFRAALSPTTFRAAPFAQQPPKATYPKVDIPKATYPKRQYRRETIASQQKAGYAIATINDGLLPTGS